jgi:hypothetical protein
MVVKLVKNFDLKDCIHYKQVAVKGCCGRTYRSGLCTVVYRDDASHKTCGRKMKWCQYEKKERS